MSANKATLLKILKEFAAAIEGLSESDFENLSTTDFTVLINLSRKKVSPKTLHKPPEFEELSKTIQNCTSREEGLELLSGRL